jgi:hypothetical protein
VSRPGFPGGPQRPYGEVTESGRSTALADSEKLFLNVPQLAVSF